MTRVDAPSPWLLRHKAHPKASLHLFCFPYAGGGVSIFRTWQSGLPAFIDVCPVLLPGRTGRLKEKPFTNLSLLVQAIAESLHPQLSTPFAFFGHSMGAIISFELARVLRRQYGSMPVHLFVSGRRAPQSPSPRLPSYDLPEPQFKEKLRELKGTPREVLEHPELMQLVIPILRADFSICQTYEHSAEPPLDVPITVFGGLGDEEARREQLQLWKEQTTSNFSLRMFPGDHFFLHNSEHQMLAIIAQELHRDMKMNP